MFVVRPSSVRKTQYFFSKTLKQIYAKIGEKVPIQHYLQAIFFNFICVYLFSFSLTSDHMPVTFQRHFLSKRISCHTISLSVNSVLYANIFCRFVLPTLNNFLFYSKYVPDLPPKIHGCIHQGRVSTKVVKRIVKLQIVNV